MRFAHVLDFLIEELGRHGADLVSATDLSALAAIEHRLDGLGLPDDDLARAVAWIASLTPDVCKDAFGAAFGEPAAALLGDLLPARQPSRGGRMDLRIAWAQATAHADPQVRGIAVALLAGEAEKASGPSDREQLRTLLDIAVRKAPEGAVRNALAEVRDGLAVTPDEPAASAEPTRLISVSIDVVGSTEAKRRLRDLGSDEGRRAQLYQDFYSGFLRAEDRFYEDLFAPGLWGNGPPLEWRRLFVVKGIGDELWLLYDVAPPQGVDAGIALRQAATRLLSAALSLVRQVVPCGGTAEDLGPLFDREAEERQRCDFMNLPFKVSMDLVEDAIEISAQRLTHFADRAGSYLAPPHEDTGPAIPLPFGASHAEILRRLNVGHFELTGGHRVRQAYRTDFIGPDIDRFFRITKFALPGTAMLGDDLMKALHLDVRERYDTVLEEPGPEGEPERKPPEFDRILPLFPCDLHDPDSDVTFSDELLRRSQHIARDEMKGIDATYAVHHLVGIPSFRGILNAAIRNAFLESTVAAYPPDLLERLAPPAREEASDDPMMDDAPE